MGRGRAQGTCRTTTLTDVSSNPCLQETRSPGRADWRCPGLKGSSRWRVLTLLREGSASTKPAPSLRIGEVARRAGLPVKQHCGQDGLGDGLSPARHEGAHGW